MQVIGAGFGRTGTLSLKRALEELGVGPTYHMQEAMRRPSHVRHWLDYADSGEADWDGLFANFGSGVDYPVCCVWEELASHYPNAKVVLTVRDPERWWESTHSTVFGFRTAFAPWFQRAVPAARRFVEMVERLVWQGLFDGRFADRDHATEVFTRHIEYVRSTCPPERLLVFDVAEGWGPLCEFLDVPEPDRPFPHLNDGRETRRAVKTVRWGTRAAPVIGAALAGLILSRAVR
jgi:hypothetical protein